MSEVIRSEQQIYTEGYDILMFCNWNHYCLLNPFVEGIGPSQIYCCGLLTGSVPYQYYVHSLGLFTACLNSFYVHKVHYQSETAFPWMRDMTGHWTALYYIIVYCILNVYWTTVHVKKTESGHFPHPCSGMGIYNMFTDMSAFQRSTKAACSLTCQFSRGPWKQHSWAWPIRAPLGLTLRATPMGGLLTVSKNARVP